ncbi:alkaline phosphatase D family protein [Wocania ichthyoenteri]|uniref:alkaline phosphatase D family protein n=1 Tax=Wocania ichthyoenteri TaxID=1230531 RepID=UPI0009DFBB48|nr:alkaline phosphatase D family protein [Wocania ichthyoenteri]
MNRSFFAILLLMLFFLSCKTDSKRAVSASHTTKIAFGSCGHQTDELTIFNNIVNHNPDLFIFLGDNIYGDTKNMDTLKYKYNLLGTKPTYKNLKKNTPILATWDDHDFGWNDAGKEYPFKEESKDIFLDFFEEPDSSSRRQHKGIYHSYSYDYGENKLQIILLDGRTFRDSLLSYNGEKDNERRFGFYGKDYTPHTTNDATLLGEEQWIWLEKELQKPADIRIIGTGTQFGIEWNGYEAWANFPHEQERVLNLIRSTKANGVLFISGDVHYSEISKLETDFYPIYDFTSSGLSSTWHFATPNNNRIEGPIMDNHFGLITINWNKNNTDLKMETWDINDNQRIEYTVKLKDITAF